MSAASRPADIWAIRAVPCAPRPVKVCLGEPFTPFVGTAVEEYFLGGTRINVKVLCGDGSEACVPPCFLAEDGDLSNVVILRPVRGR